MNDFIEKIKGVLLEPLPGAVVQGAMLPGGRKRTLPSKLVLQNARKAGVCIVLYQRAGEWHTILIKRTTYEGVHSGQIALPGGTYEEVDTDLIATAVRETEEEVGIAQNDLEVLGQLSSIYIPPSKMYVEPTVALLKKPTIYKRQEFEVAEIIEVPIDRFLEPGVRKTITIEVAYGTMPNTPYFDIKGEIVWGATASIMNEFAWVLRQLKNKKAV